jgi:hypothetical protein
MGPPVTKRLNSGVLESVTKFAIVVVCTQQLSIYASAEISRDTRIRSTDRQRVLAVAVQPFSRLTEIGLFKVDKSVRSLRSSTTEWSRVGNIATPFSESSSDSVPSPHVPCLRCTIVNSTASQNSHNSYCKNGT